MAQCGRTLERAARSSFADGEFDWWEEVPPDLVATLAGNSNLVVAKNDPIGSMAMLRFNHLQSPFDNVEDAAGGAGSRRPVRVHDRPRG